MKIVWNSSRKPKIFRWEGRESRSYHDRNSKCLWITTPENIPQITDYQVHTRVVLRIRPPPPNRNFKYRCKYLMLYKILLCDFRPFEYTILLIKLRRKFTLDSLQYCRKDIFRICESKISAHKIIQNTRLLDDDMQRCRRINPYLGVMVCARINETLT